MKRGGYIKRRSPLRARRWTADEALWRAAKEAALERDQYDCQADARGLHGDCRGPLEIHHVLPRSRGGKNDLANLITLCRHHHYTVHAYPARSYELGLLARSAA